VQNWEREDEIIQSCSVVTTEVNELMAQLHDRMPVILDPEHFDWWMAGSPNGVGQLSVPSPSEWLNAYAIGRRVNDPRN
jgi:putative SOS response-associated peptidase YedK